MTNALEKIVSRKRTQSAPQNRPDQKAIGGSCSNGESGKSAGSASTAAGPSAPTMADIAGRRDATALHGRCAPMSDAAPTPSTADRDSLTPCLVCGSAIRWLNAAGHPRCQECHPPKIAALIRSREILVALPDGARRWERLIEVRRNESGGSLPRLVSRSALSPAEVIACGLASASDLTEADKASMVATNGEAELAAAAEAYGRWRELPAGEVENFFKNQKSKI